MISKRKPSVGTPRKDESSGIFNRESLEKLRKQVHEAEDRQEFADIMAVVREEQDKLARAAKERESSERLAAVKAAPPGRVKNKRSFHDNLDAFELVLLRNGISMDDLLKASRTFDMGTHTPYAKLAHVLVQWWCSVPMGGRRVVWVDPDSGFTERTLPKFSTAEGQDLLARGLAGAVWVSTRKHLLEARAWAKRMMQLTPEERVREPIQIGDERLTRR